MTTEIPIEIREAAEQHAGELKRLGAIVSSECQLVIDSFLDCYKFLTSGQPDGWCAWHPEAGYVHNAFHLEEIVIARSEADAVSDLSFQVKDESGWQIIPVRLLKCGGENV